MPDLGFDKVAKDTSHVFESYERVALLIDESAHRKKGQLSVGVARQVLSFQPSILSNIFK